MIQELNVTYRDDGTTYYVISARPAWQAPSHGPQTVSEMTMNTWPLHFRRRLAALKSSESGPPVGFHSDGGQEGPKPPDLWLLSARSGRPGPQDLPSGSVRNGTKKARMSASVAAVSTFSCGLCGKALKTPRSVYAHLDTQHAPT